MTRRGAGMLRQLRATDKLSQPQVHTLVAAAIGRLSKRNRAAATKHCHE
jgi:hypothetical protein